MLSYVGVKALPKASIVFGRRTLWKLGRSCYQEIANRFSLFYKSKTTSEFRTLAGAKYLGSKCVCQLINQILAELSEVTFETPTMASNQFAVNTVFWGDMRRVYRLDLFEELGQSDEHDTKDIEYNKGTAAINAGFSRETP